jgi:hypothetical protein
MSLHLTRARWRLVPPEQLEDVTLSASHILIRHRDASLELSRRRPCTWSERMSFLFLSPPLVYQDLTPPVS